MNSKLYVGNLSFDTTEAGLRSAFGAHGTVTDIYVATDRMTGRPRGFAFVTMSTEAESQAATASLNGTELDGRAIAISVARPKEAGSSSFAGNRRS